jgi:hypothetical protein
MNIDRNLHPYLDKILSHGIATDDEIDPIIHNCTFKLNLEKRNEYMLAECNFSNATISYAGKDIAIVKWVSNGVMFEVIHYCYPIVEMVSSVLETIQELKEI